MELDLSMPSTIVLDPQVQKGKLLVDYILLPIYFEFTISFFFFSNSKLFFISLRASTLNICKQKNNQAWIFLIF